MADNTSPATKQDVQILMEGISNLYAANQRWKDEIIHEFKVVAEDIRHDAMGAQKDRIEQHDDRIKRLEKHTKLIAA
ncbi:hypothetical protein HYZ99_03710 [Candidatus Peregrinibacteria bacterium]|nr:hypothetical protein [Candidatus Peregrinibacteria bacterium]